MGINKKVTKSAEAEVKNHAINVIRAKDIAGKNVIMFDVKVDDVTIYGCSYRELERKDGSGSFASIGFPSRKGSDDKWYNHAYVKFSEADIVAIEKGIEAVLD